MYKYDRLWCDINNLLTFLQSFDAVGLVREYYSRYGNDAPPAILDNYIKMLQEHLNKAQS